MSGGFFDYRDYMINEFADEIEQEVVYNDVPWDSYFGSNNWTGQRYSNETIEVFKKTEKMLRECAVLVHRVDYLLSGDDSEESFHRRIKEDMEKLNSRKPKTKDDYDTED